jgi:hypothetical protein
VDIFYLFIIVVHPTHFPPFFSEMNFFLFACAQTVPMMGKERLEHRLSSN